MNAPITYKDRGKTEATTFRELRLTLLVDRALTGDLDAAELVVKILPRPERYGDAGPGPIWWRLARGLSRPDRQPEERRVRSRARRRATRMVVVTRELIEGQVRDVLLSTARGLRISLGQLHPGQVKAYWALQPHRSRCFAAEGGSARRSSPRTGLPMASCKARSVPGLLPAYDPDGGLFGPDANACSAY